MIKELCQHWETYPQDYDFIEREDRKLFVDMMLADNNESIVEFACGTGIIPYMLRKYGYKGDYVGTDITRNFIDASLKNTDEYITFMDLDDKLYWEDELFDSATISTGIGYCKDIEKTFRELHRIIKRYLYIDQYTIFFSPENNLRFLRGEGWGNTYNKQWFEDMLKRVGFEIVLSCMITNDKDVVIWKDIHTSRTNQIYKLKKV
jgi:ubiquinone/menaquinone biosynthesis C-methylase UbiE